MAENLFQDSFGHYNVTSTQMPTKWTSASGSIVGGGSLPTGSGYAFRGVAAKTIGNYLIVATGIRQLFEGTKKICEYQNQVSGVNISFDVIGDGRVRAGVSGTFFKFSTFALTFGAVYQFQVFCQFTRSASGDFYDGTYSFQVYVNGVLRLSDAIGVSGVHYNGGGVGDLSQLNFSEVDISTDDGGGGWGGDFWITDGELLGQCPLPLSLPIADGPVVAWTPSTGSDHFACVNTQVPTDVKYNFDASVGDIDEYQMATVPSGTVKGLQVVVRLEKDAPGTASLQIVYRNASGTTVLSTPVYAPSEDSYAFFLDVHRKSVFTGLDWTTSEINGCFFGIKRVA